MFHKKLLIGAVKSAQLMALWSVLLNFTMMVIQSVLSDLGLCVFLFKEYIWCVVTDEGIYANVPKGGKKDATTLSTARTAKGHRGRVGLHLQGGCC